MISKLWWLNMLLAVVAVFCLLRGLETWQDHSLVLPAVAHGASKPKTAPEPKVMIPALGTESKFKALVQKNPFSPDRKEDVPEAVETLKKPSTKSPERKVLPVVLYGVVLTADSRKALISNPVKKDKGNKLIWVTQGQVVGPVTVIAIDADRIRIKSPSGAGEVMLYDASKYSQKEPVKRPDKPQVITTGSSHAVSTKPAVKAPVFRKKAPGVASHSSGGGTVVIQTPFGKIKRKK